MITIMELSFVVYTDKVGCKENATCVYEHWDKTLLDSTNIVQFLYPRQYSTVPTVHFLAYWGIFKTTSRFQPPEF